MRTILLQTTIPYAKDDWSIERFSQLTATLGEMHDASGNSRFRVIARDRENLSNGDDRVLSNLDESDIDQLWLFGVDVGGGLSGNDCAAIGRFRARGGSLLTTRDHQDLGVSFCTLGGIGAAHHFHSKNPEANLSRHAVDDTESPNITWPNYHSGSNGDFQRVDVSEPIHPIMRNEKNASGRIETLPAHPHEGAISVPSGANARVVARGRSTLSGREFNIAIAFDDNEVGRAVADSSFHHFLDYNLDPSKGCPSYVTEPPGRAILDSPAALADAYAYMRNLAGWLG